MGLIILLGASVLSMPVLGLKIMTDPKNRGLGVAVLIVGLIIWMRLIFG